jgi:hypothetical protein
MLAEASAERDAPTPDARAAAADPGSAPTRVPVSQPSAPTAAR